MPSVNDPSSCGCVLELPQNIKSWSLESFHASACIYMLRDEVCPMLVDVSMCSGMWCASQLRENWSPGTWDTWNWMDWRWDPNRGPIENLWISRAWVGGPPGEIQTESREKNLALIGTTVHWHSNYDLVFIVELKMNRNKTMPGIQGWQWQNNEEVFMTL